MINPNQIKNKGINIENDILFAEEELETSKILFENEKYPQSLLHLRQSLEIQKKAFSIYFNLFETREKFKHNLYSPILKHKREHIMEMDKKISQTKDKKIIKTLNELKKSSDDTMNYSNSILLKEEFSVEEINNIIINTNKLLNKNSEINNDEDYKNAIDELIREVGIPIIKNKKIKSKEGINLIIKNIFLEIEKLKKNQPEIFNELIEHRINIDKSKYIYVAYLSYCEIFSNNLYNKLRFIDEKTLKSPTQIFNLNYPLIIKYKDLYHIQKRILSLIRTMIINFNKFEKFSNKSKKELNQVNLHNF